MGTERLSIHSLFTTARLHAPLFQRPDDRWTTASVTLVGGGMAALFVKVEGATAEWFYGLRSLAWAERHEVRGGRWASIEYLPDPPRTVATELRTCTAMRARPPARARWGGLKHLVGGSDRVLAGGATRRRPGVLRSLARLPRRLDAAAGGRPRPASLVVVARGRRRLSEAGATCVAPARQGPPQPAAGTVVDTAFAASTMPAP